MKIPTGKTKVSFFQYEGKKTTEIIGYVDGYINSLKNGTMAIVVAESGNFAIVCPKDLTAI